MICKYLNYDVGDISLDAFIVEVARARLIQEMDINTTARAITEALGGDE